MTFKKIQESKQIGTQIVEGQEIAIIHPEVHREVKNKNTALDYDSEEAAQLDLSDPNKVVKLPDVFGQTKND